MTMQVSFFLAVCAFFLSSASLTQALCPPYVVCQNGGTCVSTSSYGPPWQYVCVCPRGIYGSRCQFKGADIPRHPTTTTTTTTTTKRYTRRPFTVSYPTEYRSSSSTTVYWSFTPVVLVFALLACCGFCRCKPRNRTPNMGTAGQVVSMRPQLALPEVYTVMLSNNHLPDVRDSSTNQRRDTPRETTTTPPVARETTATPPVNALSAPPPAYSSLEIELPPSYSSVVKTAPAENYM